MLLIVDDDPRFLESARQELGRNRGVLLARHAQQAKELMASVGTAFTVALIDLDMPGQDGFSLIREMRQHFPDLPLIAMSGVVQRHVLESAKAIGAADALPKPITPEWSAAIARVSARAGRGAAN